MSLVVRIILAGWQKVEALKEAKELAEPILTPPSQATWAACVASRGCLRFVHTAFNVPIDCRNPGALGIKPQEMDSYFGEGSAGAAIELRLIRFAGAILEQAKGTISGGDS